MLSKNYKILHKIQGCLFPFYYSCPENKTKQKLARDSNNISIKETLINEKDFLCTRHCAYQLYFI